MCFASAWLQLNVEFVFAKLRLVCGRMVMPANKRFTLSVLILYNDDHHRWCLSSPPLVYFYIIEILHMLNMKMSYFVMHYFCVFELSAEHKQPNTSTAANYFALNYFLSLSLAFLKRSQRNKWLRMQFLVPGRWNLKQ